MQIIDSTPDLWEWGWQAVLFEQAFQVILTVLGLETHSLS